MDVWRSTRVNSPLSFRLTFRVEFRTEMNTDRPKETTKVKTISHILI